MDPILESFVHYIHKGIKAMLYDSGLSVQRTNFNAVDEANACFNKVERALQLTEHHLFLEGRVIMPFLKETSSAKTDGVAQLHRSIFHHVHLLQNVIVSYTCARNDSAKANCGIQLNQGFSAFVGANLQAMDQEENMINEIIGDNSFETEFSEYEQRLLTEISLSGNEWYHRWMFKALNDQEVINWLKSVLLLMDESHFNRLCVLAEQEVSMLRWRAIKELLDLSAVEI